MMVTYLGDAELARLLRADHAGVTVAEVRALVAGVLAAPAGHEPAAWTRLVAAEPSPRLVEQLRALALSLAPDRRDGRGGRGARLAL
ncbi:MAG: aminopeptidase P family protein, partial [Alphaproteobacteria bacterium]